MRRRYAAAAVSLVFLALAPGAGAAPSAGFTPSVLAGTWTGTWTNETFKSTGTLSLKISGAATALKMTAKITGNTFGCAPPGPQTFSIPKGAGVNHWSAAGFSLYGPSPSLGVFRATYSYPSGAITASGKNPACAPGLSFSLSGRFSGKSFTAKATIKLPAERGGGTATTTVSLTRS
jgi:hypothetical protein